MASTYTPLGVELQATGENAGTWGTKTNTNLQIIEQISGGYTVQLKYVSGSGDSVTWATTDKGWKIIYATANDGTNPDIAEITVGGLQEDQILKFNLNMSLVQAALLLGQQLIKVGKLFMQLLMMELIPMLSTLEWVTSLLQEQKL